MDRPSHHVGVNILVIRGGELLLGKRKGAAGVGEWGLVGGHLEHAETLEECAVRELSEEVGLIGKGASFIGVTHEANQRGEKHYVNFAFSMESIVGEPELREPEYCAEWKWFHLDDLPKNLFFGHKDLINNYLSGKMFSEWKSRQ